MSPRPDRRAQLTAALARLLPRVGWAGATTGAIAAEAGLTTGLVHYHFQRKLDILIQLMDELQATVDARRTRRLAAAGPDEARRPAVQLRALVDAHLAQGPDADPGAVACWVAIAAEAVHDPELGPLYRGVLATRTTAIAALLRALGHSPAAAARRAGLATAAIEGAYLVAATSPGLIPEGSAADGVWEAILAP